ncbi:MAG: DUF3261 domain-containing protein [Rhizomicrobium sp.]|jgi:hypothetical protein
MNAFCRLFPLTALALCGCVTSMPNAVIPMPDNQAVLAPDVACAMPPPSPVGGTVYAAQNIVAHFRGQTYSFEAQIQSAPGEFDLVAMDSLGRRAMSVKWRGGHMDYTRADWLPADVRPADILGDVAIVFWPTDAIAPALAACGALLTAKQDGRIVKIRNREVIDVTYEHGKGWNRAAHLSNLAYGFSIDIQSAEIAP